MPYTVDCTPAPVTITIRPNFNWNILLALAWVCFVGYGVLYAGWHYDIGALVVYALTSLGMVLSFVRRERIEIYPDQMVWRKTYFGLTRSKSALLGDVLAAEWCEGEERGREHKGPDYIEFYLTTDSVKACFGFTFEEFDRMREDIRSMYPDLVKRWGNARIRSKDFTLLNLS